MYTLDEIIEVLTSKQKQHQKEELSKNGESVIILLMIQFKDKSVSTSEVKQAIEVFSTLNPNDEQEVIFREFFRRKYGLEI